MNTDSETCVRTNDDGAAWAERGDYWGAETDAATVTAAPRTGKRTKERAPLILTGHGVSLCVDGGALVVRDGFTHYPQKAREHRFFPGDRALPSRIVLLDSSGGLSFAVIEWLAAQGIPLVVLDWRGAVVSVLGAWAAPNVAVRAAQLAAATNGADARVAAHLIGGKLRECVSTLETLPASDTRSWALERHTLALRDLSFPVHDTASVQRIESGAAYAYFTCWQGLPVRWKATKRHPVPEAWHAIGGRASLLNPKHNKNATHPVNAMLNYAYGVLEAQTRIAATAAGLDAELGFLHARQPGRVALVYDLMEPLRPAVDRAVLRFIDTRTFDASDFALTTRGVCRLHPQLARTVASLATSVSATGVAGDITQIVALVDV